MRTYIFEGTKNYYDEEKEEDRIIEFKTKVVEENLKKAVKCFERCYDEDVWSLTLEDGRTTTEFEWQNIKEDEK